MVNSHLLCDPTIRESGFDLPRQQWSLLNRFLTEQGHCGACRRKWRLSNTVICVLVARPRRCLTLSNPVPWQTEWRLISATLCGWGRCFVADQLWFMTRIREEEVSSNLSSLVLFYIRWDDFICRIRLRRVCIMTWLSFLFAFYIYLSVINLIHFNFYHVYRLTQW